MRKMMAVLPFVFVLVLMVGCAKPPQDAINAAMSAMDAAKPLASEYAASSLQAAAMATVASPYLGRSGRRTAWLLVALVAVARMYVGAHFPADVIGGFAVGWVVGETPDRAAAITIL